MIVDQEWLTPRLRIRPLAESDFDALWELQGDPEATRFIGGVWTKEKTRQTLRAIITNYRRTDLEWLAVTDTTDGSMLGVCWLAPLATRYCKLMGLAPQIELGYRYARRHWGRGIATEAAREMLRRGFEELALEQVVAVVSEQNIPSDRVLQKCGLKYRKSAGADDARIKLYMMDTEDYLAARPAWLTTAAPDPLRQP